MTARRRKSHTLSLPVGRRSAEKLVLPSFINLGRNDRNWRAMVVQVTFVHNSKTRKCHGFTQMRIEFELRIGTLLR